MFIFLVLLLLGVVNGVPTHTDKTTVTPSMPASNTLKTITLFLNEGKSDIRRSFNKINLDKFNDSEIYVANSKKTKNIDGRSTIFIRNSKHRNTKIKQMCENNLSKKKNSLHLEFIKELLYRPHAHLLGLIDPYEASEKLRSKYGIKGVELQHLDIIPHIEILHLLNKGARKKNSKVSTLRDRLDNFRGLLLKNQTANKLSKSDAIKNIAPYNNNVKNNDNAELRSKLLKDNNAAPVTTKTISVTTKAAFITTKTPQMKEIMVAREKLDNFVLNTRQFLVVPNDNETLGKESSRGNRCRYYICTLKNPSKGIKSYKIQLDCKCNKYDNQISTIITKSGKKIVFSPQERYVNVPKSLEDTPIIPSDLKQYSTLLSNLLFSAIDES